MARYLAETARVLRPGGRARAPVRQPPAGSPASRLVHALPGRRCCRAATAATCAACAAAPAALDRLVAEAGLVAERELGRGTADHWLVLVRPGRAT